jgi:hypothetical protein
LGIYTISQRQKENARLSPGSADFDVAATRRDANVVALANPGP